MRCSVNRSVRRSENEIILQNCQSWGEKPGQGNCLLPRKGCDLRKKSLSSSEAILKGLRADICIPKSLPELGKYILYFRRRIWVLDQNVHHISLCKSQEARQFLYVQFFCTNSWLVSKWQIHVSSQNFQAVVKQKNILTMEVNSEGILKDATVEPWAVTQLSTQILQSHILQSWFNTSVLDLMVQWSRIRLPMQGTWVQSLVWEDSTCCGATKSVCCNC